MTSIPDYYRTILKINLRLIMQLLSQPFHFMSNVENLHLSRSVFSRLFLRGSVCALSSHNGYDTTIGLVEKIKVDVQKQQK